MIEFNKGDRVAVKDLDMSNILYSVCPEMKRLPGKEGKVLDTYPVYSRDGARVDFDGAIYTIYLDDLRKVETSKNRFKDGEHAFVIGFRNSQAAGIPLTDALKALRNKIVRCAVGNDAVGTSKVFIQLPTGATHLIHADDLCDPEQIEKVIYYYKRDKKGNPVETICLLIKDGGMHRGRSKCNRDAGDIFLKKEGRRKARERAEFAAQTQSSARFARGDQFMFEYKTKLTPLEKEIVKG